jgi:hypothetical protein
MAKFVRSSSGWITSQRVEKVFSVSACLSEDFCDWIDAWLHNGHWLFDSQTLIQTIASAKGLDLSEATWFYYEAFEEQFDPERGWHAINPDPSFPVAVERLEGLSLAGYDVATYSYGNVAECSPLSCNALADEIDVNEFCLIPTFEEAFEAVAAGRFNLSEPGPYRILAVHTWNGPD